VFGNPKNKMIKTIKNNKNNKNFKLIEQVKNKKKNQVIILKKMKIEYLKIIIYHFHKDYQIQIIIL
jgi:hypothetical protein